MPWLFASAHRGTGAVPKFESFVLTRSQRKAKPKSLSELLEGN